MDVKRQVSTWK